jgi:hypothetical protein
MKAIRTAHRATVRDLQQPPRGQTDAICVTVLPLVLADDNWVASAFCLSRFCVRPILRALLMKSPNDLDNPASP